MSSSALSVIHHVDNGLGGHLVPYPNGRKEPARGSNDRSRPPVVHRSCQRWVGDRHRERCAEPLAQRDGERQADNAAARDQHIHVSGGFGG